MYSCLVGIFILASHSLKASFAQICQQKLTPFGCAMTSFENLHPPFSPSIFFLASSNESKGAEFKPLILSKARLEAVRILSAFVGPDKVRNVGAVQNRPGDSIFTPINIKKHKIQI